MDSFQLFTKLCNARITCSIGSDDMIRLNGSGIRIHWEPATRTWQVATRFALLASSPSISYALYRALSRVSWSQKVYALRAALRVTRASR